MAPRLTVDTGELSSYERILERAIEVIEKSGEVGIRTNPIAIECGVTPPILYRAFGNREGLIVAAQAERYRRSSLEASEHLFRYIAEADSRESLRANFSRALDLIFGDERAVNRRLRAEVLGSSISRPALREQIRNIDRDYAGAVATAYAPAVDRGWISADKNLFAIALWGQGIINMRVMVDDTDNEPLRAEWDRMAKHAILHEIFG